MTAETTPRDRANQADAPPYPATAAPPDGEGAPGLPAELRRWRWICLVAFPLQLLLTALTMGLRSEHLLMAGIFIGLAWMPPRVGILSWRALPLGLTALAYDNSRFLSALRGRIHVADLYHAELRWFGIETLGGRLTLPEYFARHTVVLLDLLCGLAYMVYIFELVLMALYFGVKEPKRMARLGWGFFVISVLGIATYLLYPAAPPWYVMRYGLGPARLNAAPSAAGTARFDALLGISYFRSFYARNPNVFGAMPSLHVGYPMLCFFAAREKGRAWAISTLGFALLVAFSAIYLQHHYVFDAIVGAAYAWLADTLVAALLRRREQRATGR
ncbi:MAG: inositol phosphorylceramide synthase [Proteobacteria bacterium]|nr:inositol phosphorylceramide synthase [Pseudomonadota bacterium]